MKYFFLVSLFTLFLSGKLLAAIEVTQCIENAWAHPGNGGLGLNRSQAVELCSGAANAIVVTQCFENALAHPDNGGLGLNRGQAVELCSGATNAIEVVAPRHTSTSWTSQAGSWHRHRPATATIYGSSLRAAFPIT